MQYKSKRQRGVSSQKTKTDSSKVDIYAVAPAAAISLVVYRVASNTRPPALSVRVYINVLK